MGDGKIIITIDKYRQEHNISKYKIIKNCQISATQLNYYCRNELVRVDLAVLARICDYLHCEVGDLLKYIPPDDQSPDDNK